MKYIAYGIALCCISLVLGCGGGGPDYYPVSGVVTIDGKPLEGASISMEHAEGGRPAVGVTDASGKFTMHTVAGSKDGVKAGLNKIAVIKFEEPEVTEEVEDGEFLGTENMKWLIPVKYGSSRTSDLTVEVTADMAPVELNLKS